MPIYEIAEAHHAGAIAQRRSKSNQRYDGRYGGSVPRFVCHDGNPNILQKADALEALADFDQWTQCGFHRRIIVAAIANTCEALEGRNSSAPSVTRQRRPPP